MALITNTGTGVNVTDRIQMYYNPATGETTGVLPQAGATIPNIPNLEPVQRRAYSFRDSPSYAAILERAGSSRFDEAIRETTRMEDEWWQTAVANTGYLDSRPSLDKHVIKSKSNSEDERFAEYIKKNLRVETKLEQASSAVRVEVSLFLGDTKISTDADDIDIEQIYD